MSLAHPGHEQTELECLSTDQDEIFELLERYDALAADRARAGESKALAEELCSLLLVHAAVKEEIFYAALREVIDEERLIDEALVMLDSARSLMDDIQNGDPTQPRYDEQVRIQHELVTQHFDEERTQLFAKARASTLDLEKIGGEIAARQELLVRGRGRALRRVRNARGSHGPGQAPRVQRPAASAPM